MLKYRESKVEEPMGKQETGQKPKHHRRRFPYRIYRKEVKNKGKLLGWGWGKSTAHAANCFWGDANNEEAFEKYEIGGPTDMTAVRVEWKEYFHLRKTEFRRKKRSRRRQLLIKKSEKKAKKAACQASKKRKKNPKDKPWRKKSSAEREDAGQRFHPKLLCTEEESPIKIANKPTKKRKKPQDKLWRNKTREQREQLANQSSHPGLLLTA